MTRYETVCVVRPDVQADRLEKVTEKIKKVLAEHKCGTLNRQDWGVRKLAYPIQKFKTAHYLYFTFEGGANLVNEMERQLSYDDAVLRYLTHRLGKNDRTDIRPDNFQFGKAEAESYSHPFGGGPYERRERRWSPDRRAGGQEEKSDSNASSDQE